VNKKSNNKLAEPVRHTQGSTEFAVTDSTLELSRDRVQLIQRFEIDLALVTRAFGTQSTFLDLETVQSVDFNRNGLTFCEKASSGKSNNNKCNRRSKNSQRSRNFNIRNQKKRSGGKINNTKGYKNIQKEKFSDKPTKSYKPFTEAQKLNFARLIKESLDLDEITV
jgi:hypothetical protein